MERLQRKLTLSAQRSLVLDAANGSLLPFVLDMPRHAAHSTNVAEGLGAPVSLTPVAVWKAR